LFEYGRVGQEGLAASPVALVVRDPRESHPAEFGEQVPGKLPPVLVAADGRGYALGHDVPHGADDLALFVGEPEVAIHAHKHATLGPFNGPGYACSPCACTTR